MLFDYYSGNVFRFNKGLEVVSHGKFFVSSDLNALIFHIWSFSGYACLNFETSWDRIFQFSDCFLLLSNINFRFHRRRNLQFRNGDDYSSNSNTFTSTTAISGSAPRTLFFHFFVKTAGSSTPGSKLLLGLAILLQFKKNYYLHHRFYSYIFFLSLINEYISCTYSFWNQNFPMAILHLCGNNLMYIHSYQLKSFFYSVI